MNSLIYLALFSGIAVATAIFLAVYLQVIRQEDRLKLLLLSGLFVAIGLRIAKSVFYYISEVPAFGVGLGHFGLAMIGPLLWLYVKHSYSEENRLSKPSYLHFFPGVVGFLFIWLSRADLAFELYLLATGALAIYLSFSWILFSRKKRLKSEPTIFNRLLLISASVVCLAFGYQLYSDTVIDYALGAAVASLLIYIQFFYVLKTPRLFPKAEQTKIDSDLACKVKQALEVDKVYQKSSLTINDLATQLGIPAYIISKAIKYEYGKPFPELINHFRINDVKERLSNQQDRFIKIEGLAYEVGFSTPSAFYAAFKKETSLSPSQFRKQVANQ